MSSSLLQRVLDDPADESARLVYADALLDAGDPRGELIAVEHRWERERSLDLARRRAELRRTYGRTWWPEAPTQLVRSRCGFAEAVALTSEQLTAAARLFETEPIVELELIGHVPPLSIDRPQLQSLVVRSIDGAGLAAVLSSLRHDLRSLDISGSSASFPPVVNAMPRCDRLLAANCGLSLEGLIGWEHLDDLRELDLSCNDLDLHELQQFLDRGATGLVSLHLSGNRLREEGAIAIAEALQRFPRLTQLELVECELGHGGVERLRERRPPELAIAFSSIELARPHSLDHVGGELVLRMAPLGGWTISHDGVPREIAFRQLELDSIGGPYVIGSSTGTTAPLERIARAIAMGAPRSLSPAGISLSLWPLRYDPSEPIITADIRVPDEGPIEIDIETYID